MDQTKIVGFLANWVVNILVLLIAAGIFRNNVVLGNANISTAHAAIILGLVITLLSMLVAPAVAKSGIKIGKKQQDKVMGAAYLAANALFLWILKRLALVLGLGISNVLYVILTAILLTCGQWAVAIITGAMKKQ